MRYDDVVSQQLYDELLAEVIDPSPVPIALLIVEDSNNLGEHELRPSHSPYYSACDCVTFLLMFMLAFLLCRSRRQPAAQAQVITVESEPVALDEKKEAETGLHK